MTDWAPQKRKAAPAKGSERRPSHSDLQSAESKPLGLNQVISPKAIAESLTEYWSPRVAAEIDDSYAKVAKVLGTLAWHAHEQEDELFHVLKGNLQIEMEHGSVYLNEGDSFVVPKGVRHNPIAEQECHLMLIEKKATLHTGSETTARTRGVAEQLRPV